MPVSSYPTTNLHLPSNKTAIRVARFISLIGGDVLSFAAIVIFFDWVMGLNTFGESLANIPVILALITSSVAIFFYKKNNKFQLLGLPLILIGVVIITVPFSDNSASFVKNGIVFLLIGLSLMASILKIPHRYHFMQIIALGLLVISLFTFLVSIYNFVASGTDLGVSFWESIIFFTLCQSIIFIKPDRGFVGLFMTESRSGQLARMSLLYFLTLPLCLGFIFLIMDKINLFDVNARLAFLVAVTILFSIIIIWMNVRILYSSEVEHFVMREALRINNISLEMNATDLSTKMVELEQAKQEVTKKFDNQQSLVDLMDQS